MSFWLSQLSAVEGDTESAIRQARYRGNRVSVPAGFPEKLRRARLNAALRQRELSEMAGAGCAVVRDIESGKKKTVPEDLLDKLRELLADTWNSTRNPEDSVRRGCYVIPGSILFEDLREQVRLLSGDAVRAVEKAAKLPKGLVVMFKWGKRGISFTNYRKIKTALSSPAVWAAIEKAEARRVDPHGELIPEEDAKRRTRSRELLGLSAEKAGERLKLARGTITHIETAGARAKPENLRRVDAFYARELKKIPRERLSGMRVFLTPARRAELRAALKKRLDAGETKNGIARQVALFGGNSKTFRNALARFLNPGRKRVTSFSVREIQALSAILKRPELERYVDEDFGFFEEITG